MGIPEESLRAVTACVRELLAGGDTVVLMDSAGAERTKKVCKTLGFDLVR